MQIPHRPAAANVSSCLRVVHGKCLGDTMNSAASPRTNLKNSISTGWNETKSILVEIKVVPQMIMVSNADKCPAVLFFDMYTFLPVVFSCVDFFVVSRCHADETTEICRKMALI